jgi:S-formylglutathione hydrolase FrmB
MARQRDLPRFACTLFVLWLVACSAGGGASDDDDAIVLGDRNAGSPLSLVDQRQLSPRLLELQFATPALEDQGFAAPESGGGTGKVRLLLPAGYARSQARYPVLVLLHGAEGNYRDWTDHGAVEALTANLPLIVVMPDGGAAGQYTDHYNAGRYGPPAYESYHVGQLIPWIDLNLRTVGARAGRAVAGVSMGGFGAMSYAARHPDLFAAAAAFSGAVDTNDRILWPLIGSQVFGSRSTAEVRWRGSNPVDLAPNLANLRLILFSGNGEPNLIDAAFDLVERVVYRQSENLHEVLVGLGIAHDWIDYGPGSHTWPYWQQDLRETLPALMQVFANPAPAPSPLRHAAIEAQYEVFGWRVELQRPALEFSTLSEADRTGFVLEGSGSALVRTPAFYAPGSTHVVEVARASTETSRTQATADPDGRLWIGVPLGRANAHPQYTIAAALAGGTKVYTARVAIDP